MIVLLSSSGLLVLFSMVCTIGRRSFWMSPACSYSCWGVDLSPWYYLQLLSILNVHNWLIQTILHDWIADIIDVLKITPEFESTRSGFCTVEAEYDTNTAAQCWGWYLSFLGNHGKRPRLDSRSGLRCVLRYGLTNQDWYSSVCTSNHLQAESPWTQSVEERKICKFLVRLDWEDHHQWSHPSSHKCICAQSSLTTSWNWTEPQVLRIIGMDRGTRTQQEECGHKGAVLSYSFRVSWRCTLLPLI